MYGPLHFATATCGILRKLKLIKNGNDTTFSFHVRSHFNTCDLVKDVCGPL